MAGADDHVPAMAPVADAHRALGDRDARAGAPVLGQPARAADRGRRRATDRREAPALVAAPEPARGALLGRCAGRAGARARREVAAGERELGDGPRPMRLTHAERAAGEQARLRAVRAAGAGQPHGAVRRVDHGAQRHLRGAVERRGAARARQADEHDAGGRLDGHRAPANRAARRPEVAADRRLGERPAERIGRAEHPVRGGGRRAGRGLVGADVLGAARDALVAVEVDGPRAARPASSVGEPAASWKSPLAGSMKTGAPTLPPSSATPLDDPARKAE